MIKTPGDIIILHICTTNDNHMIYGSWDMVRDRCNCYFSFCWGIFCPFTSLTTQKTKILKKWKKNIWRYYHFTYVNEELWSDDVQFPRYGARQTDGQTDRQTDGRTDRRTDKRTDRRMEKVTQRWVPCLKKATTQIFFCEYWEIC